jgi:predicted GH43/DUF377 family glycosyl hydrolase
MKPGFRPITVMQILLLCVLCAAAQTQWTKYATNPVMAKQNWITETYAIGQPTCLMERDTFKMWYVAGGFPYITSRLLYAFSTDGINWTKYNNAASLMDPGAAGAWDRWMDTPEIVRDTAGYKLYYFGDSGAGGTSLKPSAKASIGVAFSTDGTHWTKYSGNPVLTHGSDTEWDRSWIESPAVLFDSASHLYRMWYSGVDTSAWRISVGLATSSDGFTWTKYTGNPVLTVGPAGSHDDMWAAVPAVIKTGSVYEMWYSGFSSTTGYTNGTIGYATSPDGINWTKYPGNPLFDTHTLPHTTAVDSGGPWAPDVVFDGKEYKMWYETLAGFSLATAPPNTGIFNRDFGRHRSRSPALRISRAGGSLIVELPKAVPGTWSAGFFDAQGRLACSVSGEGTRAACSARLLPGGVYFVRLLSTGFSPAKTGVIAW